VTDVAGERLKWRSLCRSGLPRLEYTVRGPIEVNLSAAYKEAEKVAAKNGSRCAWRSLQEAIAGVESMVSERWAKVGCGSFLGDSVFCGEVTDISQHAQLA
jgi:hypothetical protein